MVGICFISCMLCLNTRYVLPYMIKLKSKELVYLLYRCLQELTSSSQRTGPRHRARKHSENSSVSNFQFNSYFLYTYSRSYFT